MYYIVSEIYAGRHFLVNFLVNYSQQIIPAVANESVIPYNLTKRALETQKRQYCSTKCHPKPNHKKIKIRLSF